MDILVIDTATERSMFAYVRDGEPLVTSFLPFGLQEGQKILGNIHQDLGAQQMSVQDIDAVAVGVGPGSYTGMRIAATIGKMLSYVLKIPLVGICTLETFSAEQAGAFAVVLDAKVAGIYLQLGKKSVDGHVDFFGKPRVVPLEQALQALKDIHIIVSPNVKPLQEKLKEYLGEWEESPPQPLQMALIAEKKILTGPQDFELLYLRS